MSNTHDAVKARVEEGHPGFRLAIPDTGCDAAIGEQARTMATRGAQHAGHGARVERLHDIVVALVDRLADQCGCRAVEAAADVEGNHLQPRVEEQAVVAPRRVTHDREMLHALGETNEQLRLRAIGTIGNAKCFHGPGPVSALESAGAPAL